MEYSSLFMISHTLPISPDIFYVSYIFPDEPLNYSGPRKLDSKQAIN